MKMINVQGRDIVAEHITAVGPVKSISTGSMMCDWDYGFVITTSSGKIEVLVPTETDSLGNHLLSQVNRVAKAEQLRKMLIEELGEL